MGEDDSGQDLHDARVGSPDRGHTARHLSRPHEKEPLDWGHALLPDRGHEGAVDADDRVGARLRKPPHGRLVTSQAGDEV